MENHAQIRALWANLLLLLGACTVALLAAEWVAARYLQGLEAGESMAPGLLHYDAHLGWRLSANWQGEHRHRDYVVNYQVNAAGFRVSPANAALNTAKVAVLGDSYTFGLGVADEDTLTNQLTLAQRKQYQYLNFGVPGFSPDQSLLQFEQLMRTHRFEAVILVLYLGNDVLDVARGYPLQVDFAKPQFTYNNGVLIYPEKPVSKQQKPAALRQLSLAEVVYGDTFKTQQAWWQQRLGSTAVGQLLMRLKPTPRPPQAHTVLTQRLHAPLALLKLILQAFEQRASSLGIPFHLVMLGGRDATLNSNSAAAAFQDYVASEAARWPLSGLKLNLMLPMRREADVASWYFRHDGHLTAVGNAWVADRLARHLSN